MRCLLQELLNGGDQDIVEGDVRQLPGLLTVILRHIGDEQAALSVVAHHHAILVCDTVPSAASWLTTALHPLAMAASPACPELQVANRRFMHEAMAKAQRLEVMTSA